MKYFLLTLKKMLRYLLKPLSFLPALCMMYLIYSFSAQTGEQSSQVSQDVGVRLIRLASRILNKEPDAAQVLWYAQVLEHYIRKLAHITEYFLLAVSVALPLYVYKIRGFWLVLTAGLFCVAFAGLDEYHQSFVAGRSASPRDVMIDSIGIFSGIYVTRLAGFIGRKTIFAPLSLKRASRSLSQSQKASEKVTGTK